MSTAYYSALADSQEIQGKRRIFFDFSLLVDTLIATKTPKSKVAFEHRTKRKVPICHSRESGNPEELIWVKKHILSTL